MNTDLMLLQGVRTEEEFMLRFAELMKISMADGRATPDTIRTYASHMGKYLQWCYAMNIVPLHATIMDIRLYRSWMVQQDYKKSTISLKLGVIRRFYQSAVEQRILKENPAAMVGMARDAEEEMAATHYLTAEEAKTLFKTVPKYSGDETDLRARGIIGLMALQGLRTVEVHRLNVEDYSSSDESLYIRGKKRNRRIYLREEVRDAMLEYIDIRQKPIYDNGHPIFVAVGNRHGGGRLSRDGVRDVVDFWLEEAKLKKPGLSCHCLRHTFGTLLYETTKDLRLVQEELGHAKYETTTRYAHIVD